MSPASSASTWPSSFSASRKQRHRPHSSSVGVFIEQRLTWEQYQLRMEEVGRRARGRLPQRQCGWMECCGRQHRTRSLYHHTPTTRDGQAAVILGQESTIAPGLRSWVLVGALLLSI